MAGPARKSYRDNVMTLLVLAALLVLLVGIYLHEIQALLPIAAMLLALRIFLQSEDRNVRRFAGALTFGFAASTLSNIAWYLIPAVVEDSFVASDNYYYITGMFWIVGYVAIAYVLAHLKNSRQWYIERRLDRGLTVAGAVVLSLIVLFVFLNIDWSSPHLIDVIILLIYLFLDVIILMLSVKLLAMNLKIELRYLLLATVVFFGINMAGDLLFESRWLFHLSKLLTFTMGSFETTLTIRNATNDIYNISLIVMTAILFFFALDLLRSRKIDEMRGRLKDTQLFVDDLIAKSPDATCIFDRDGRLALVNDPFLQIFGLTRKDIDRSFNIFSHVTGKIFQDNTYAEILNAKSCETVIIPKLKLKDIPGGRQGEFYLSLKMFPSYGSDGRVSNYVLITEDITVRIDMEMALRQSEEKFRVLAETSPAAICLFRDDQFLYVNPAVERISGYSREEFAGMKLWDLLTPEYRNLLKERLDARKNGVIVPSSYEIQFISKSNGLKWVNISVGAVDINDMPAFMVSAFDITERKQAEKALRESEEKFRALAEMAPMAIGILQDGRFKYTNPAMETITGYGKEELRSIYFMDMVHDDSRKYVEKLYSDWLDGVIGGPSRSVITGIRKGVHGYWFDLSWKTIDYEGRRALLLTGVDVTERKRAEEALRESEEQYRNLVENVGEWIWENDREGRFTYSSPKVYDLLGYRPEQVIGLLPHDLMTPENAEKMRDQVKRQEEKGEYPQVLEAELLHKDGHTVFLEVSGKPVYDRQGNQTGFRGVSRDVTARKQAEEALRESQRFQSTLISNLPGMVYRCRNDTDWTMEYASEGCSRLTGYEPAEILHNQLVSYNNLIHPDDREYVRHTIQAALDLKTPFQITYRVRTRQGTEKWVWEQGRLAVPGSPEIIEGFITDITDRKQAEEALRESEEKFRVLAETSPAAIIIYQGESIVYVNPAFEKTVGYTLVELLTMKPWDFMHPDYRGLIMEKVLLRKQGVPLAEHYDAKILTKDGRELWSSNWTTMTTYMNRLAGMIIAIDITDRKQAEEALRESEARYRALIDNSPLGILTCDLEGNVTSINPQILEILGSKSPEFTMSVNLLNFEPVIKFSLAEILRDCIITGESRVAEKSYTSHWGKSVYLGLHLTPLRDHAGQIYSVLCVMEDITARKRLEGDLRKAYSSLKEEYERKIDFTNAAAHELRTPLTPIIGYTDILKAEVKDERHRGFLEIIERNALRQKTLVNRMLELASLDAGMAHVNCVELAVRPLVLEIADNYRAINPHIRVEVPEGLLINTDPDILRHVLDNLVSNAVKYSDNDKEVEIRIAEAGDSYRFSVKDHGAGIPKEEWGKIFERFYIVGGDSDSRTSGRSGLGLALVKAYICLIGGDVWLESEPGKGSTFFFTVPRKPSAGGRGPGDQPLKP